MSNKSRSVMEHSFRDLCFKVEDLTAAILAAAGKETLFQKAVDIKHEQILNELNAIKQSIDAPGLNGNAMTVEKLADQFGLNIGEPDRMHGQYFGAVVGLDRRAWLIQVTSTQAVALTFNEVLESFKPRRGDQIRMDFQNGALTTSIRLHPANAHADQARLNPDLAGWGTDDIDKLVHTNGENGAC